MNTNTGKYQNTGKYTTPITEKQIIHFAEELQKKVRERDTSYSVDVQYAQGFGKGSYVVHIVNALGQDSYHIDIGTGDWIRSVYV